MKSPPLAAGGTSHCPILVAQTLPTMFIVVGVTFITFLVTSHDMKLNQSSHTTPKMDKCKDSHQVACYTTRQSSCLMCWYTCFLYKLLIYQGFNSMVTHTQHLGFQWRVPPCGRRDFALPYSCCSNLAHNVHSCRSHFHHVSSNIRGHETQSVRSYNTQNGQMQGRSPTDMLDNKAKLMSHVLIPPPFPRKWQCSAIKMLKNTGKSFMGVGKA